MNSLDSIVRVTDDINARKSEPMHKPVHEDHDTRIAIMTRRWKEGRNIFTGVQLSEYDRLSRDEDED